MSKNGSRYTYYLKGASEFIHPHVIGFPLSLISDRYIFTELDNLHLHWYPQTWHWLYRLLRKTWSGPRRWNAYCHLSKLLCDHSGRCRDNQGIRCLRCVRSTKQSRWNAGAILTGNISESNTQVEQTKTVVVWAASAIKNDPHISPGKLISSGWVVVAYHADRPRGRIHDQEIASPVVVNYLA